MLKCVRLTSKTSSLGRHDTQHNDIQRNDTQHNDIQLNDTQHNNKVRHSA